MRPAPEGHRNVEFKEVTFAYHEGETILSEVSFSIPAKKVTALVGPSGGKTTVFSLIERFYAIRREIYFGSEGIRDYTLESWRRKLGYVPGQPLMTGTIRDNIVYGREEPVSDEEIAEARLAYAEGFIEALPRGYDTEVGERGIQLSGGQRQRVAIARACAEAGYPVAG